MQRKLNHGKRVNVLSGPCLLLGHYGPMYGALEPVTIEEVRELLRDEYPNGFPDDTEVSRAIAEGTTVLMDHDYLLEGHGEADLVGDVMAGIECMASACRAMPLAA